MAVAFDFCVSCFRLFVNSNHDEDCGHGRLFSSLGGNYSSVYGESGQPNSEVHVGMKGREFLVLTQGFKSCGMTGGIKQNSFVFGSSGGWGSTGRKNWNYMIIRMKRASFCRHLITGLTWCVRWFLTFIVDL
jgi:hypothetical protein